MSVAPHAVQPPPAVQKLDVSHDAAMAKQTAILFVGRALACALALATPLVLVRLFSREEYGSYKQLLLVAETLAAVLPVGLTASLYYFIPTHFAQRRVYIINSIFALAVSGVVGGTILTVFRSEVGWGLNNPDLATYLAYCSVFTLFYLIASILESLMVIMKQTARASLTTLGSECLRAALVLGAATLTGRVGIVVLSLIAWSGCRVIALGCYLRRIGALSSVRPRWMQLRGQLHYASPFGLAVIMRTAAETLHLYVVAHMYTPAMFAVYSIGCLQIPIVGIATDSVTDIALVRLTELRRDGDLRGAVRVIHDGVRRLALVLVPLWFWLTVYAREVVLLLFTDKFEASVDVVRIFLVTIPLAILGLEYVPRAFADVGFILRVNVVRLALNVLLLSLLTGRFGILGAASATVGATVVLKVLVARRVGELIGVDARTLFPWWRLLGIAGVSAGAVAIARAVQGLSIAPGAAALIVSFGIFCVCYVAGVLLGNLVDPAERREAVSVVRRIARLGESSSRRRGGV